MSPLFTVYPNRIWLGTWSWRRHWLGIALGFATTGHFGRMTEARASTGSLVYDFSCCGHGTRDSNVLCARATLADGLELLSVGLGYAGASGATLLGWLELGLAKGIRLS